MARNQNTLAKRIREMEKKRRAEEKRARRQTRKDEPAESLNVDASGDPTEEDPGAESVE